MIGFIFSRRVCLILAAVSCSTITTYIIRLRSLSPTTLQHQSLGSSAATAHLLTTNTNLPTWIVSDSNNLNGERSSDSTAVYPVSTLQIRRSTHNQELRVKQEAFHLTTYSPPLSPALHQTHPITTHHNVIFFLKTHKTGGTVIQNIVLRQALMRNLSVGLSSSENDWSRLCMEKVFTDECLCNMHEMRLDVIAHHMIFRRAQIKGSMKAGAKFVSILRDPADVIVSAYTFFSWNLKFSSFDDFLNQTVGSNRLSSHLIPYRNIMMYVFGLRPWEFDKVSRVQHKLTELESAFDLIMINDEKRFNQSLVLLKELMGWTVDDVVAVAINKQVLSTPKSVITDQRKRLILKANHADYLLYQKFLQVFDSKVAAFGEDRMREQIELLVKRTDEQSRLCVSGTRADNGSTVEYILTAEGEANALCRYMTTNEMEMTMLLIQKHNDVYKNFQCHGG